MVAVVSRISDLISAQSSRSSCRARPKLQGRGEIKAFPVCYSRKTHKASTGGPTRLARPGALFTHTHTERKKERERGRGAQKGEPRRSPRRRRRRSSQRGPLSSWPPAAPLMKAAASTRAPPRCLPGEARKKCAPNDCSQCHGSRRNRLPPTETGPVFPRLLWPPSRGRMRDPLTSTTAHLAGGLRKLQASNE